MDFDCYISESDTYMISLIQCMDNAHAAEKLYQWSNIGNDNIAWEIGPYISAGANQKQIDHKNPYCLRMSSDFSKLVAYVIGPNPNIETDGGVTVKNQNDLIESTAIIPTVAINMQYALLESFEFDSVTAYLNKKDATGKLSKKYRRTPVELRLDILSEHSGKNIELEARNAFISLSRFRNILTHEPNILCEKPETCIDVFIVCQAVAHIIIKTLGTIYKFNQKHRIDYWEKRIKMFIEIMDFN
jgi:hypothetical protein